MQNNKRFLTISFAVAAIIAMTVYIYVDSGNRNALVSQKQNTDISKLYQTNSNNYPDLVENSSGVLQLPSSVSENGSQNATQTTEIPKKPIARSYTPNAEQKVYLNAVFEASKPLDFIHDHDKIQAEIQNADLKTLVSLKSRADQARAAIKKVPIAAGMDAIASRYDLVYREFSDYMATIIDAANSGGQNTKQKIDAGAAIYLDFVDNLQRLYIEVN